MQELLTNPYTWIALMMGMALGTVLLMLNMGKLFASKRPGPPAKYQAYESGLPPTGEARVRLNVAYYQVAVIFVIFDVETVFLILWAANFDGLGLLGIIEVFIFIFILMLGFVYAWKKGYLNWADGR